MDNSFPPADSLYDPLGILGTDSEHSGEGTHPTGGTGPTVGPAPAGSGGFDFLGTVFPGSAPIVELIKAIGDFPKYLLQLVTVVEAGHPIDTINKLAKWSKHIGHVIDADTSNIAGTVGIAPSQVSGQSGPGLGSLSPYNDMLQFGLGVNTDDFPDDAKQGVALINQMLAFTFVLQFTVALIEHFGTGLFANRWAKALKDTVAKIPEAMGLSWVLGMFLEKALETAVGMSIEEAINVKYRGNRIGWPQLRTMLKQHVIPPDDYVKLLKKQGFPDEQIDQLTKLSDAVIPIGDIQQLYLRGMINGFDAHQMIEALGYSKVDIDLLYTLYVDKAETEAGTALRSTARSMFTDNLITEEQYRTYLERSHYPPKEIDNDVEAVNLIHTVGRLLQSVQVIKTRYMHQVINPDETRTALKQLNYTDTYITELMDTWSLPPLIRSHPLSQAKILSYYLAGILKPQDAHDHLAALGLNPKDITLLLDHPTINGHTRVVHLSPSMVVQAYIEGAIHPGELESTLKRSGVQPDDMSLWVSKAQYRSRHTKGTPTYTASLTAAEVREAYKYSIIDVHTAQDQLELLGYSPDNATTLLEITNRGLFQPPVPPLFNSVEQARAYLQSLGWTVTNPPDPRIAAAEQILAQNGYSWIQPYTPVGGTGTGTGTGGGIGFDTGHFGPGTLGNLLPNALGMTLAELVGSLESQGIIPPGTPITPGGTPS